MPIIFSYDLSEAPTADRNRIQSVFQRFGWENIGGSCYRYPKLVKLTRRKKTEAHASEAPLREDWLNHVIPALMCFQAYVRKRNLVLAKHSLDTQASTGSHGATIRSGDKIRLVSAEAKAFGEKQLRKWLNSVAANIPY